MKGCPDKKDLTLYYYNELPELKIKAIKAHLSQCSECLREYEELVAFSDNLSFPSVEADSDDYKQIAVAVEEFKKRSLISKFKAAFGDFSLGFNLDPKLIAAFAVVALLIVIPFTGTKKSDVDLEILKIELELSLEGDELSVFDVLDEQDLFEDMSLESDIELFFSKINTAA